MNEATVLIKQVEWELTHNFLAIYALRQILGTTPHRLEQL